MSETKKITMAERAGYGIVMLLIIATIRMCEKTTIRHIQNKQHVTNSSEKIILEGTIQTDKKITDTKFKLYLEYEDKDGLHNKIYYEVARG